VSRRGIALLQFGGPDSPEAIRPFLRDLFDDREILPMPALVRKPLAWTIAKFRAPKVAANYAKMGGASPIGMWTEKQADALRRGLPGVQVEVAMRSWRPATADAVAKLLAAGCGEILALPLYPQYSFTTTRSSMTVLLAALKEQSNGRAVTLRTIRSWPTHPGYVAATCETARRELAKFASPPHVLFNAHGLPVRIVAKGDPYPDEIRATVEACAAALGLPRERWSLSFQSRVGPVEWLRPYTEDEIPRLAKAGVRELLVVPMSFVCDHFETLYEMRILQADIARAAGVTRYVVAPALNDEPAFLAALVDLARDGFERAPAERI
jgi:protoporphyrin/coproporphyrin ferrochelatase